MRSERAEFPKSVKEAAWARCKGRCEDCGQDFAGRVPDYHHVVPAALGGDNSLSNAKVLCKPCHRLVTTSEDLPRITKAKSIEEKRAGLRRSKTRWPKQGFRRTG